jgi:non-canonical purine NTP pyrophosphatase (RdgB/HAM1 family)
MKELIFVTSNDNKAREVAATLGVPIKRVSLELDEIQEMDLKKIIDHKAKQAYHSLKKPVLVEDDGLFLDDWSGFPGPFIKHVHATIGYDKLPKLISRKNRRLEWIVAYGLYDGKNLHYFQGVLKGSLALSERGRDGWGFDTLLIPNGFTKTTAELGGVVKLKISARRKALEKVKRFLKA